MLRLEAGKWYVNFTLTSVQTNFSRPTLTEIKLATTKCHRFNVHEAQYVRPDKELSSTINCTTGQYHLWSIHGSMTFICWWCIRC